MTPTPLGEGKTLTTVGLAQALNRLGHKTIANIRQPSLGPVFGIKGGAAGGGNSQVVPMEDFNLHLTGDTHAVSMAHNLLSALIDNHLNHGNELDIDPFSITWPRVSTSPTAPCATSSSASAARKRLPARVQVRHRRRLRGDGRARSSVEHRRPARAPRPHRDRRPGRDRTPVTANDLKAAGAMTVLLRDAIKPNLLQTLEHGPVFVHTGPFGNIAHGNSSVLADRIGLKLADLRGHGERLRLATWASRRWSTSSAARRACSPDAAVIVATVRALKAHSGKYRIVAGRPLPEGLGTEDLEAVEQGMGNLQKHIENVVKVGGLPAVVCVNRFSYDSDAEVELVKKRAIEAGAFACEMSEVWEYGGAGGEAFAKAVVAAANQPNTFEFVYPDEMPIEEKISAVAVKMYGADGADFTPGGSTPDSCLHGLGPRQPAGLHGQVAVLAQRRRR